MNQPHHEKIFETSTLGIGLSFSTVPGGYQPSHWHDGMEILYPLNGEAEITVDNKNYNLPTKNATVVDSFKIHSTFSKDSSMLLRILIPKEQLKNYMPDIMLCHIDCIPQDIRIDQFEQYYKLCELLAELTRLYIYDVTAFRLSAEGLILQAAAHLIRYFSTKDTLAVSETDPLTVERIRSVIRYVETHYQENISLQYAAAHIGISREYFCRIFKKNTGSSFLQYLNDVRLSKIYGDLQTSSLSVSEIMEKNGITSQKQFNLSFKKRYGCTPSAVRRAKAEAKEL